MFSRNKRKPAWFTIPLSCGEGGEREGKGHCREELFLGKKSTISCKKEEINARRVTLATKGERKSGILMERGRKQKPACHPSQRGGREEAPPSLEGKGGEKGKEIITSSLKRERGFFTLERKKKNK